MKATLFLLLELTSVPVKVLTQIWVGTGHLHQLLTITNIMGWGRMGEVQLEMGQDWWWQCKQYPKPLQAGLVLHWYSRICVKQIPGTELRAGWRIFAPHYLDTYIYSSYYLDSCPYLDIIPLLRVRGKYPLNSIDIQQPPNL